MARRLQIMLALCGALAGISVLPTAANAFEFNSKITVVNLSGKTLVWDEPGSFAYSRTEDDGSLVNTARYVQQPDATLADGGVTTFRVAGLGLEGLYARVKYQDTLNADNNVTFESHVHLPPHGNWASGWSDAGFVVDFNQNIYTDFSVGGTAVIRQASK